ncbi:DUF1206 domain-containing protein [Pararhizobium sp. PWRC1-1]|uniref:DUF1206 domain-containing protein n=1 Tax=Pararhizobium sp. PWRC1-1 TaxID=2804566 RepID=UPI003CFA06A3
MQIQSPFQWLARSGYAARGTVYVLVSGLALFSSFGGGKPDSKSALQVVLEQPLGRIWLGLIAVGLVGFIAWRVAQALANADGHPNTLKGLGVRFGLLISAVVYSSLAIYAASMAFNIGGQNGSEGESELSAWLIDQPFGRYLLAGVGVAVVGAGIAQVIKGVGHGYRKYLDIPSTAGTAIDWICVYGLAARGVVFLITGVFFLYAAFVVDPDQAGGISDALAWVRQLPFGAVLYAVVAIGLLAFGLYGFVEAAYRRIRPPPIPAPLDGVGL